MLMRSAQPFCAWPSQGDGGNAMMLRDFRKEIPALEKKLRRRGIPGVFLELEPHLKGGGQFGGFSGPDGLGVASRRLVPRARRGGNRLSPAQISTTCWPPAAITELLRLLPINTAAQDGRLIFW